MTGGEPAVGGLTSLPCAACSQLAGIFHAVRGRRRFGKPDVGGRGFIISVDFTPGERIFVHSGAAKGSRGGCPFPTDAHPSDSSGGIRSPRDGGSPCGVLYSLPGAGGAGWLVPRCAPHGHGPSKEGAPRQMRKAAGGHQELVVVGGAGLRVRAQF